MKKQIYNLTTKILGAYISIIFTSTTMAMECENPSAQLYDEGMYITSKFHGRTDAKKTATEYTNNVSNLSLLKPGSTITAKSNHIFGFRYLLKCKDGINLSVPVTIRVKHPKLTNPKTSISTTSSEWDDTAFGNYKNPNIHAAYSFDENWEKIPGKWIIQVIHNKKVIIERDFNVSKN